MHVTVRVCVLGITKDRPEIRIQNIKENFVMGYQNIDAVISAADLQAVRDAFETIVQKLPFLVTLTAEERRLFKAGSDSLSFVEKALTTAKDYPTILPASFDNAGFKKDVELFAALTELNSLAASVVSQIDDTRMAVGREAIQEGSQVYKYVQAGAKTTPGLKTVADQLGERFKRAGKKTKLPKPSA